MEIDIIIFSFLAKAGSVRPGL